MMPRSNSLRWLWMSTWLVLGTDWSSVALTTTATTTTTTTTTTATSDPEVSFPHNENVQQKTPTNHSVPASDMVVNSVPTLVDAYLCPLQCQNGASCVFNRKQTMERNLRSRAAGTTRTTKRETIPLWMRLDDNQQSSRNIWSDKKSQWECNCPSGFVGIFCEIPVNPRNLRVQTCGDMICLYVPFLCVFVVVCVWFFLSICRLVVFGNQISRRHKNTWNNNTQLPYVDSKFCCCFLWLCFSFCFRNMPFL